MCWKGPHLKLRNGNGITKRKCGIKEDQSRTGGGVQMCKEWAQEERLSGGGGEGGNQRGRRKASQEGAPGSRGRKGPCRGGPC